MTVHRHRFARLQIGAETMRDPELWVGPVHLTPIVDMLLGADWLMGKRISILMRLGRYSWRRPSRESGYSDLPKSTGRRRRGARRSNQCCQSNCPMKARGLACWSAQVAVPTLSSRPAGRVDLN